MDLDTLFELNLLSLAMRWTLVLSFTIITVLLLRRLFQRIGAATGRTCAI